MDVIELKVEPIAGGTIVRVGGEVDVATADQLRRTLGEAADGMGVGDLLAVDLSATEFIDSAGLGVLVGTLKRVRDLGGEMKLVVSSLRLVRVFELTKLTKVVEIVADERDLHHAGPLRHVTDLAQATPALDELVAIIGRGAEAWNGWRADREEDWVDLSDVRLRRADLAGYDLSRCDLRRADLSSSILRDVDLRGSDLRTTDLESASLVDCDLSRAACQGIRLDWAHLRSVRADGTDLRETHVHGADIVSSTARGSTWDRATLEATSLHGTSLADAHLTGTTVTRCDLSGVDLRGARLTGTSLRSTLLSGCRLGGSMWSDVVVADSDYSAAEGLDEIEHEGTSSIAVDAVARSLKDPNLGFLAAAGIPRSVGVYLVDALRAESSDLLRYGSVFLAHSSMNTVAVDAVYDRLRQAGVNTFIARYDLLPGDDLDASIDREIGAADHVLLFCSRASLDRATTGWWVDRELRLILDRERRQARSGRRRRLLIPVLLDHHLLSEECDHPLRSDIATRVAADLSSEDTYEEELTRLLRAIRAVPFVEPTAAGEAAVTPRGRGAVG